MLEWQSPEVFLFFRSLILKFTIVFYTFIAILFAHKNESNIIIMYKIIGKEIKTG